MAKTSPTVRNRRYLSTVSPRISELITPRVPGRSLAETHPAIAKQWHHEKNAGWGPEDLSYGSGFIVWWRCPKGRDHEWEAKICDRTSRNQERGCPFCTGALVSETNSLATLCPELIREWCTERNGISASQIVAGSAERCWWKCRKGADHYWQAQVNQRKAGSGCPACANQQLSTTNSLANKFPELAKEWYHSKNKLKPSEVIATTMSKFWWRCSKNPKHSWQASCSSRALGSGCKKCNVGESINLKQYPEALRAFDNKKNIGVDPFDFPTDLQVWWRCPVANDHIWLSSFNRKTENACMFCKGLRTSKSNNLAIKFPRLAKEWFTSKNDGIGPQNFTPRSSKRVWWRCAVARDHVWQAAINQRVALASGCPFCVNQRASVTNSLQNLFPEIAREWHPSKNHPLSPSDVVAKTNKKFWWKCAKNKDHVWESSCLARTSNSGRCPYCANRRVSKDNCLRSLHPRIASEWDNDRNAPLTSSDVAATTSHKFWWRCKAGPDHSWKTSVYNRTVVVTACPFCTNKKVSMTNCLATKFPRIAKEWHPTLNAPKTAKDVLAGSGFKFWFQCAKGHEWICRLHDRTVNGSNCPDCALGARLTSKL
jgi:hypothetical protein